MKYLNLLILRILVQLLPDKSDYRISTSVGVCSLLCHRDVYMFIINIFSLSYFTKSGYSVYIVDDGTLTVSDKRLLRRMLYVKIEEHSTATKKINTLLKAFPYVHQYRFHPKTANLKLTLDVLLLAPFEKFIYMDADLLFQKRPEELLRWMSSVHHENIHMTHTKDFKRLIERENERVLVIRNVLSKLLKIRLATPFFTNGLLGFSSKRAIDLLFMNKFLKLSKEINFFYNEWFLDSTMHCLMFNRFPVQQLDPERYLTAVYVPGYFVSNNLRNRILVHFTGWYKNRYAFYASYLMILHHSFRHSSDE